MDRASAVYMISMTVKREIDSLATSNHFTIIFSLSESVVKLLLATDNVMLTQRPLRSNTRNILSPPCWCSVFDLNCGQLSVLLSVTFSNHSIISS